MTSAPNAREWLKINAKIGALSFGSVSRITLYQEELVERRQWLSAMEFQEALTLAQILPGPNLINACICLSLRWFSLWTTGAALLCVALPGAILAIFIALWFPLEQKGVSAFMTGCSIAAFLLMGKLLLQLGRGVLAQDSKQNWHSRKILGRLVLTVVFIVASLNQVAMLPLIAGGVVLCIGWEFLN